MWPFYPFFPWWGYRPSVSVRRPLQLRTFKVDAALMTADSATVNDLAIDPVIFRQLPNQCILLFEITMTLPASRLPLPVNVVVERTVGNPLRSFPVVDTNNTPITGADIPQPTQLSVYLNKTTNTFRILDFEAGAAITDVQTLSAKTIKN
jgi:hypothetical protein